MRRITSCVAVVMSLLATTAAHADDVHSLAVDQVSGKFYITRPGYPGPQSDPRLIEYETVAYDASGNQLWMTRYHASTNAYPVAVAVDPRSGHLYVTGS